jgi:hypothetical protein
MRLRPRGLRQRHYQRPGCAWRVRGFSSIGRGILAGSTMRSKSSALQNQAEVLHLFSVIVVHCVVRNQEALS